MQQGGTAAQLSLQAASQPQTCWAHLQAPWPAVLQSSAPEAASLQACLQWLQRASAAVACLQMAMALWVLATP
jgi:hypothetical protein